MAGMQISVDFDRHPRAPRHPQDAPRAVCGWLVAASDHAVLVLAGDFLPPITIALGFLTAVGKRPQISPMPSLALPNSPYSPHMALLAGFALGARAALLAHVVGDRGIAPVATPDIEVRGLKVDVAAESPYSC